MLIATKLQRPRIVQDYLERPRLVSMLEEGRNRKLTLIAAPAGYGKSSLVAAWLARAGHAHVWLSLDRSDGDLTQFLGYLAAGMRHTVPDSCSHLNTIQQSAMLPPIPYIAAGLINDLNEIQPPLTIVLDDFQFVDSSLILDLTQALLQYLPHHVHLLIITRQDPPLPLVKMRARQESLEIRTENLRFSEDETGAFLRGKLGDFSTAGTTKMLAERTEGWPVGLRLATLALQDAEDFAHTASQFGATGDGLVTEYLISEVLEQATPEMKEFMLKTAICNRLCVELCDALLDDSGSGADAVKRVEALRRTNLFIVELDNQGQWWRYHHLFQELLQHRLYRQIGEAEIGRLHRRAGNWYAEHDFLEEAFEHALAAEDFESAVALIEQQRYAMLNEDRWHTLERWLSQLPENVKRSRPDLILAQAWVAYFHHSLQAIPALMDQMGHLYDAQRDAGGLAAEVRFFQALGFFWAGDGATTLTLLDNVLEQLPAAADQARGEANIYRVLALQMMGKHDVAVQSLYQELYAGSAPSPVVQTRLLGALVFVHLLCGDLDELFEAANRALVVAKSAKNAYAEAWMHYLLGFYYFAHNELDQAAHYFELAVAQRYVLHTRAAVDSLAGLALTHQARGESALAESIVAQMVDFATSTGELAYVTIARSCQARMLVNQGRPVAGAKRLQAAGLESDTGIPLFFLEIPRMTYARALVHQPDLTAVYTGLQELMALRESSRTGHNIRQLIDIEILCALAYQRLDEDVAARRALGSALGLAAPGGWIRPFVESGETIAGLLRSQDPRHAQHEFVVRLLAAFPEQRGPAPLTVAEPMAESLTTREFEVLELLAQRLSNQEIAAELVISVATVKRHTANIYQKLHVNSRRRAVAKARAIGTLRSA